MRARVISSVVVTGFAAIVACSPYSPSLANEPFLCGSGTPRCPDGYSCTGMNANMQATCVENGSGTVDAGGSGSCNNDSALNNNSFATAFVTPVDSNGTKDSVSYTGLGICTASDQQFFQFTVSPLMETFCAIVSYGGAPGTPLQANLLNSSDIVNTAFAAGSAADTLQGYVANLSSGSWVIEIGAVGSAGTNNYTLEIQVSTTGATPACTAP
jgi:hypothetical protein